MGNVIMYNYLKGKNQRFYKNAFLSYTFFSVIVEFAQNFEKHFFSIRNLIFDLLNIKY
jgi:hypothetical protein